MVVHGRDRYGAESSPLFASTLDRATLTVPTDPKFSTIDDLGTDGKPLYGVRTYDRSVQGENPVRNQGLYNVLYGLTRITGQSSYAAEADAAISYFFQPARADGKPVPQSASTNLMAWGEHTGWNFHTESRIRQNFSGNTYGDNIHELYQWSLWDKAFALRKTQARNFAVGLWDHQIANQTTAGFTFSRHARVDVHGPQGGSEFPNHAGYYVYVWAKAFSKHPADATFRTDMKRHIQAVTDYYLNPANRNATSGLIPAGTGSESQQNTKFWIGNTLDLAVLLHDSANLLSPDLGVVADMKQLAGEIDAMVLRPPHELSLDGRRFVRETAASNVSTVHNYTSMWGDGYGIGSEAATASLFLKRYHQNGDRRFLDLAMASVARYMAIAPPDGAVLQPEAFSRAIDLMTDAYSHTEDLQYLERAELFADRAATLFLEDATGLPRATTLHDHYEAITGGPDLMLSMLNLYEIRSTVVPEPGAICLAACAGAGILLRRVRCERRNERSATVSTSAS